MKYDNITASLYAKPTGFGTSILDAGLNLIPEARRSMLLACISPANAAKLISKKDVLTWHAGGIREGSSAWYGDMLITIDHELDDGTAYVGAPGHLVKVEGFKK